MPLKSTYATADEIPEAIKSLYVEANDGAGAAKRFVLDVEDIDAHPKVRGVITANAENKRKRDELRQQVEAMTARIASLPEDFDADEWTRLKSGAKPDEQLQVLKDQQTRAIEALKAKHKGEVDAIAAQVAERDRYIDGTLIEGGLKDALLGVNVNPDLIDGALASLRGSVKVLRTEDGKRRAVVDTDLGEVPVTDFVKEWAGTKGRAYLAKASGPGAAGNNNARAGAKTITRAEFDKLGPVEQQKAMLVDKITVVD